MNRRLRTTTALAAAAMIALSGCGGDGGDSDGGVTTLTFLSWEGEEVMVPVIEAFEAEHENIRIDVSYSPPVAEYIQTLQTRVLSGTAPDVFLIAAENKTNLIDGEHVLDLADQDFLSTIPEFNQATYGRDGAVYGVSISSWGAGILYNPELLAEVGADGVPQTWPEFLDLCRKLQDAGITPYLESLQGMPTLLAAFLGAHNASLDGTMDAQIFDGSSSFEEQWVPSLEAYNQLFAEGLVTSDVVGLTGDQVRDEFANGRVAMMTAGPWDIPGLREAAPDIALEMVPVPAREGSIPFLAGAASPGFAISTQSEHTEEALEFLEYLASPEGVQIIQELNASITVTSDYEPTIDEALEPISEDVRAGNLYLPQISWTRAEDVLNVEAVAQLQLMAQGQVTPVQVAQALDAKLASS